MLHLQKLPQTDQLPEAQASRLLLGDCMERLAELADNSVDCILTDPPYGYNYLSKSKKLPLVRIANDRADAYPLQDRALAAACPKLKDGGWAFIFTNWQCYAATAAIVSKYLAEKRLEPWRP